MLVFYFISFAGGHVDHGGCTVFRFPLRQPKTQSKICDMTFGPADVAAIEEAFQSVDFRMFLHSTLLFTKHVSQIKVTLLKLSCHFLNF